MLHICRPVLLLLKRDAWSIDSHRNFPPAFRAAARSLLLAWHRHQHQPQCVPQGQPQSEQQPGYCLGALNRPLLEAVLGLAVYPLSAWLPRGTSAD